MKATRLQTDILAAALADGNGIRPVADLLRQGLSSFRDARLELRTAGLQNGLTMHLQARGSRDYVRVELPRGVQARFALEPGNGSLAHVLVTVVPVRGKPRRYYDVSSAGTDLVNRVRTDVAAVVRLLLGIERARRRLYELAEEGTRWLPA